MISVKLFAKSISVYQKPSKDSPDCYFNLLGTYHHVDKVVVTTFNSEQIQVNIYHLNETYRYDELMGTVWTNEIELGNASDIIIEDKR